MKKSTLRILLILILLIIIGGLIWYFYFQPPTGLNWPISIVSQQGYDPEIASSDSGYGIVWATVDDNTKGEVYLAILDSNGNRIGSDLLISEGLNRAGFPSIAWSGSEYGVVWGDKRNDDTWSRLYFTRYDSSGQKIGNDVQINTHSVGHSVWPHLIWNGNEYALFWVTSAYTSNYEVYFTRLSSTGEKLAGDIRITYNGSGNTTGLSAVWTGSEYGVSYQFPVASRLSDVYFQRVNANGENVGDPLRLTTATQMEPYPAIAWSGTSYAVVWKERGEKNGLAISQLKFAQVSSAGQLLNPPAYLSNIEWGSFPVLVWGSGEYGLLWKDGRIGGVGNPLYFTRLTENGSKKTKDLQWTKDGMVPKDSYIIFANNRYASVWEMDGGIYFGAGN